MLNKLPSIVFQFDHKSENLLFQPLFGPRFHKVLHHFDNQVGQLVEGIDDH